IPWQSIGLVVQGRAFRELDVDSLGVRAIGPDGEGVPVPRHANLPPADEGGLGEAGWRRQATWPGCAEDWDQTSGQYCHAESDGPKGESEGEVPVGDHEDRTLGAVMGLIRLTAP